MSAKCSEAGTECTSCFADVDFGALSAMNHTYNVSSLAVEMFGAFRSSLHGKVPGVWASVGCSLDSTSMSQIHVLFICNQWWIVKYVGHLRMR